MKVLPNTLFICIVLIMSSCFKDDELTTQEQFDLDQETIADYLSENNITAEQEPKIGLYYVMHNSGSGDRAQLSDKIDVGYKLKELGSDEVLEENDQYIERLNKLITGWQILIPLMQEGGSMTMYLPRAVAYSDKGVLVFEVTLNDVQ